MSEDGNVEIYVLSPIFRFRRKGKDYVGKLSDGNYIIYVDGQKLIIDRKQTRMLWKRLGELLENKEWRY